MLLQGNCLAFNGERRDPVTGLYHLGQGYRAYNPRLMRFHAADSLSPFGEGGINSYAYCLGDPINAVDPTGHSAYWGMMIGGILLAILGIVVAVATLGAATPAAAAMITGGAGITAAGIAGVAGVVSGVAAITASTLSVASLFVKDPQHSKNLGIAMMVFGGIAAVSGVASGALNAATSAATAGQNTARYIASSALGAIRNMGPVKVASMITETAGAAGFLAGKISGNETVMKISSLVMFVGGGLHAGTITYHPFPQNIYRAQLSTAFRDSVASAPAASRVIGNSRGMQGTWL
ncbi:RHS repeat-associated core domain-containing protein [Aeromonas salmonicida]|uniref:RHS repeat-associated core domain-containing protein n=1 Tax=Aeromonas salmonicida TaxID=645 RepID=UPI002796C3A8|nr:RHS repeat-associated core domain-containing protein [Aeromonas salmonicida]MDQ1886680.1 RHS repeat-associated core domain-containing protein [Aeromonas salmonicida]